MVYNNWIKLCFKKKQEGNFMAFYSRYMDEPHRARSDGFANYYFIPAQCPNCKYCEEMQSNWPIRCNAPYSSENPSRKAYKEGNRQYDVCKFFKEKEGEKLNSFTNTSFSTKNTSFKSSDSYEEETPEQKRARRERERAERELEDQEIERELEAERIKREEEQMTCPYCGNKVKEGFYEFFWGKYFHFECKKKYELTEAGKIWIKQQEEELKQFEKEEAERERKEQEEEKKDKEWFNSPFSKTFKEQHENIVFDANKKIIHEARNNFEIEKTKLEEWAKGTPDVFNVIENSKALDEYKRFELLKAEKIAYENKLKEKQAEEERQKEYEEKLAKAKAKKVPSAILCLLFGYLGIHDFYNKKIKSGIIKLCLLIVIPRILMNFTNQDAKGEFDLPTILILVNYAILFLWIFIDFIRIIAGKFVKIKKDSVAEKKQ